MPKNSFLQALFKGPKFSIAPIEENNRGSMKIGAVIPVYANLLNPREGIELNMAHLVRFLPAKAPVMEGYKVTFDAFAVPYSCLGYAERKERDIDDFFNIKENAGYILNPFCKSMSSLASKLIEGTPNRDADDFKPASLANLFAPHTLSDYLNMPSLKSVRDHVRKWLSVNPFLYGSNLASYYTPDSETPLDASGYSAGSFVALAYLNCLVDNDGDHNFSLVIDATGRGHGLGTFALAVPFSVSSDPSIVLVDHNVPATNADYFYDRSDDAYSAKGFSEVRSLLGYILENYPLVASYYGYEFDESDFDRQGQITAMVGRILSLMDEENPISLDYLQVLYDNYGIDAQSIYDEYFEYVMRHILYNSALQNYNEKLLYSFAEESDSQQSTFLPCLPDDEPIDLSYFAAYWKIISDWYINTNIDGDPDDFFLNHCHLLDADMEVGPSGYLSEYVNVTPFVRRWANDVFTSAVPESAVQNIRIPTDGTIPDLRDANAAQKLKDILRNTGNRLRDVVYGLRGVLPSAVRSEMSEPIATMSTWVGMQSVLQTSQTTPDSPQAAYSGIGTDSQGHRRMLKYINNDEPTPVIVMVLMSVTQRASYMQGFDRKFFRKSIYDFAIPQLAMVGEQEVTNKEIYFDKDFTLGIFGFNRRYYDWFQSQSQVHGDLRDSLDYWHGARFFDDQPSLNPEFIGINSDVDHLQRVFANVSESSHPILYNLSFDGYCTRALPRYIQYEL